MDTVEAEEKKPDDLEVKEEPMETESKGMSVAPMCPIPQMNEIVEHGSSWCKWKLLMLTGFNLD